MSAQRAHAPRGTAEIPDRLAALEKTLAAVREDSEVAYVLLGLSGALAEVRSVEETLGLVVRTTTELFGADRCVAASWDETTGSFELLAHWGYVESAVDRMLETEHDYPLLTRALKEKEPVIVGGSDPSMIAIPLARWGEDFGGLRLEFDGTRSFGEKDLSLARGVARQVGVALNNARRFRLLGVLHAFGLRLGAGLPLGYVVDQVLEGTIELLSADGAWIYFLDPTRRLLVSAQGRSERVALPERLARVDLGSEPWSDLSDGKPIVVPELGRYFGDDRELVGVAAPLSSARNVFTGAVLAVFERSRTPSPDESEAFRVLATHSSQAIENARRFERERSVARSLQRGLLSVDMPEIEGYEIDALYEATDSEVGGDLYDVFELPDDKYALVVGDVSGKGAEAAAQTAMVKYTLRAFATRDPAPSSVMHHLNNSLVRDLPEDRFVTVMYALFDPAAGTFNITVAGHPSPLLFRHEHERIEVVPSHGTIVGALPGERYKQSSFEMAPGDLLLAYTDGLTETRSNGEMFGIEGLAASLRRHAVSGEDVVSGQKSIQLARAVSMDARSFGHMNDDTIVLTLTRHFVPERTA